MYVYMRERGRISIHSIVYLVSFLKIHSNSYSWAFWPAYKLINAWAGSWTRDSWDS